MDLFLQILIKKEQGKNDNNSETTTSDEFLYPPVYQFPVERTLPRSNDGSSLMLELILGCHKLPSSKVEHVQFKRRKIGNVRYKENTNPSSK